MTHIAKRPKALLTVLQVMTVFVLLIGTWCAVILSIFGVTAVQFVILHDGDAGLGFILAALATVIGVSVCCYITLISFLALLQRMKKETAFTPRNGKTLGRMAGSCAIAAVILFAMMLYIGIVNGVPEDLVTIRRFADFQRTVNYIGLLLSLPFVFSVIALLIQGVRLLMLRAIALQEDQDLAV